MKKTSMPNPVKKASDISRVVPDLLKALATLLDTTVIRSVVDQEDIKPYWKSEKRLHKNVTFFLISSTVLGINNPIIYKFFKDFTNHKRRLTGWYFLAADLSSTFLNTGTTNETFQQSGKQDSFRCLLESSASMYESSGSQFFRITTGTQLGPGAYDKLTFFITFLTILEKYYAVSD